MYTIEIQYYNACPITDKYQDQTEALGAWDDAKWAAVHAPSECIRKITLRKDDKLLAERTYPPLNQ